MELCMQERPSNENKTSKMMEIQKKKNLKFVAIPINLTLSR